MNGWFAGFKTAQSPCDGDVGCDVNGAHVCGYFEAIVLDGFNAFSPFAQGKSGFKRLGLLHQVVDEVAGQNIWKTRDVVDGFFGVNLGELAARLRQGIDEMAAEFEQSGFKNGEQSNRTSADDDDICFDGFLL